MKRLLEPNTILYPVTVVLVTCGDDVLQENFALTDLPLGTYIVSVKTTRLYPQTVTIESGRLARVTFTVEPPLLSATRTP